MKEYWKPISHNHLLPPPGRAALSRPGNRFRGGWAILFLVLPTVTWGAGPSVSEIDSADLRITADHAQTFTSTQGAQAILLQGKTVLRCGERRLTGQTGVIWIITSKDAGSGEIIYKITGYLKEDVKVRPKSMPVIKSEEDRQAVLFCLATRGKVYLLAETREDKPALDQPIYQQARKLRQKYTSQLYPDLTPKPPIPKASTPNAPTQSPAPITESVTSKEVAPAPKKKAESKTKTAPNRKIKQAKKSETTHKNDSKKWEFPPRVYVQPLGQGNFRLIPQPDGTDIGVYTGGVYVFQRRPKQDVLFELRAQNAVAFSQKHILELVDPNTRLDADSLGQIVSGIYLEGDVVLEAGDYQITAEKLYYDFTQQRALVLDGVMRLVLPDPAIPLYIRAQKIRQLSQNRFQAEQVKISNDEFHQPHAFLQARIADVMAVDENDNAVDPREADQFNFELQDVTANVEDLPIFYWPQVTGDTAATQSPLKTIRTSYNSEFGMGIESEWYLDSILGLRRPRGVDSTFHLDEFSKRGPGTGIDLDYKQERYFGDVRTYILHDDGEDRLGRFDALDDVSPPEDWRGRARLRHRQFLPLDWQGTFEISYFCDPTYLESWEKTEFDTEKEQETLVYLKQQRDQWAFDFLSKFHLNDFDYTQTELPTAGFHVAGQDFFQIFTYSHEGYISRIRERAGGRDVPGLSGHQEPWDLPETLDQRDFAFAVSRHELALPLHFAGLHVAPTVIGTYAYDDSSIDNSFVLGAGGLRAATQFWHINENAKSRLWDIDRLRHIVIPEINAFWSDSDLTTSKHPDVFNFGLRQRWQTKRGPEGNKHSVDFLRFDASITLVEPDLENNDLPNKFFFTRPEQQFGYTSLLNADLSNLGLARREQLNQSLTDHARGDWTWLISDTTAVTGALNYDIYNGVSSQANGGVAVQRTPRTSYYVGNLFINNADPFDDGNPPQTRNANFLTAGASYKLNRKYTLAVAHQFDIERIADSFTDFVVIRKFPHWYGAFIVSIDPVREALSFSFSFWPEGYEKAAIGSRRYTPLTR